MMKSVITITFGLIVACHAMSAAAIDSATPCTATLGLPSCFDHNGLIDWALTPGIGNFANPGDIEAPTFTGPVSGIGALVFTITAPVAGTSLYSSGGCPNFPLATSSTSDCGGVDDWARWHFESGVDIDFSQPVQGVALQIATVGAFAMEAFDAAGHSLERNSIDPLAGIRFMGILRSQNDISRIHLDPFQIDEFPPPSPGNGPEMFTGSIQVESTATPEPSTWIPAALGIAAIGVGRFRKRT